MTEPKKYRTIWISDFHLGTKRAQAEAVVNFLSHNDAETIYLIGDVVDGWRLARKFYWPASHSAVLETILKKAKQGTKVIYITGNHDDFLRQHSQRHNQTLGNILLTDEAVHTTVDNREFLVIHGDQYDRVTSNHLWLSLTSDFIYSGLIWFNRYFNKVRTWLGLEYWSLSLFIKQKVKAAVGWFSKFEDRLVSECQKRNLAGIICGHIHKAEIRTLKDNIFYANAGDWVESCTALVESVSGEIGIINWRKLAPVKIN
jgi:UDP-2,3-diacylglucosamine pyrophosphatase LpxH